MAEDIIYNLGKAVNDMVRNMYGMASVNQPREMSAMSIHSMALDGGVTFNQDTNTTSRRPTAQEMSVAAQYGLKFQ